MPHQQGLWKGFLYHCGELVKLLTVEGSSASVQGYMMGKKQVFIYIKIDNSVICCLVLFLELGSPLGLAFMAIHHCRVCFECSAAIIVKLSQHPPNVITVRLAAVQRINYSLSLLHILGIKGAHLCAGACAKNVPVNWVWNIWKQR